MNIRDTHSFDKRLILRSPIYSLPAFDKNFEVETLVNDSVFLEAIYTASPSLYNACIKYRNGLILVEKEIIKFKHSLYKYYSRMHNRCTPFGLFSSCRLTRWKNGHSGIIIDNRSLGRHTRLDMHYLCALVDYLSTIPAVKNKLLYFPNSSWYKIGDDIRYIEYQYIDGKRQHQISAVKSSVYLLQIIEAAKIGLTIADLIFILERAGIKTDDACKFIDNCVASQLLVHELDPAVTGAGLLKQILCILGKYNIQDLQVNSIISKLKQIEKLLNELDQQVSNEIAAYQEILEIIDTLDVHYEAGKIFQTDLTGMTASEGGLSVDLQEEILTAIDILHKTNDRKNLRLESFTKRFYERYGHQDMPLLEVLDTETGIGYDTDKHLIPSSILEGLSLPETAVNQKLIWGKWEQILQKKWLRAYKSDTLHIEIFEEDMKYINASDLPFPASLQLMFELTSCGQIYVKNAGGSSAVNMIARFAQSDTEFSKLAFDLTKAEQENASGVILAEIVHLPEGRIGNILQRPAFRSYEIPCLAKSLLPEDQQIHMQDLFIFYKNKKLVLYSRKLHKIIIPRLSNAHNFNHNALPVYHFLCDLQDQDQISNLKFNWGSLQQQYSFLPRVIFKNIILQRASWTFTANDIEGLFEKEGSSFSGLLLDFKKEFNLPQKMVLADGDNELFINFEEFKKTQDVFEHVLKYRKQFIFKEYLEPAHVVENVEGEHYKHQFQAFIRAKPELNMKSLTSQNNLSENRKTAVTAYETDTNWLYYKLYCGARNADILLANPIKTVTLHFEKKGWIKEWFFIRYTDTDLHIRLRLKLTDIKWLPNIIRVFDAAFKPYRKTSFLWKVMTDTYMPEYGRYGNNTLALAEKLFYHDSISFLEFLDQTSCEERETLRWQYAILSIDTLLEAFEFKLEYKLELIKNLKETFASEFKFGMEQKKQLAKSFREYKSEIYTSLSLQQPEDKFYQLYLILRKRTEKIDPIIHELKKIEFNGALRVPMVDLLDSFIHMLVNRIIPESPRLHEVVIYDFLYQYYKSVQGMKNRIQKEEITLENKK